MKQYTVLIREGEFEFEQLYNVPDILDPEITIRTNIKRFNDCNRKFWEFVKIKRTRKPNGLNLPRSKVTRARKTNVR